MGCGGSKNIPIDNSIQQCLDMLSNRPVNEFFTQKFRNHAGQQKNMEDAYKSSIFGGSVFLPLGSSTKKGEKRDKENNLQNEILHANIDYLYGGGFYVLHNVRVHKEDPEDDHEGVDYMDIYMLVESIDQLEEMKKLKILGSGTP